MEDGQETRYRPGDPITFLFLGDEVEVTVIEQTGVDMWRVELNPPGSGLITEVHLTRPED